MLVGEKVGLESKEPEEMGREEGDQLGRVKASTEREKTKEERGGRRLKGEDSCPLPSFPPDQNEKAWLSAEKKLLGHSGEGRLESRSRKVTRRHTHDSYPALAQSRDWERLRSRYIHMHVYT